MIRKIFAGALALVAASCALSPSYAGNLAVKDANSVSQALAEKTASDGSLIAVHALVDTTLTQIDPATKQLQQSEISILGTPFQAGGSIGNTSFGAKLLDSTGAAFGTSGNPVYVTGISGGGGGGAVTAVSGAYAAGAIVDIGTGATPAANTLNARLATINTTLGTPLQAGGSVTVSGSALPTGAATAANQAPLTTPGTPGASGSTVTTVLPQVTATAGTAVSFGTSAATLFASNASRHFMVIQVQGAPDTTGTNGCYINGIAGATADANSLFIARGGYFESSTHVGTGAVSIICTGTMAVYSRQG